MPSPFPGMDPYLERPSLWPDVHDELISVVRDQLNRQLRPKYVARIQERVYVADDDEQTRVEFVPDLRVARQPSAAGQLAVATLEAAEPRIMRTINPLKLREPRIEIFATDDQRVVVTVIEILSPSNKVSGSGRESFRAKRQEVLDSTAHWVEIDLVRAGERPAFRHRIGPHEYCVHVSPTGERPQGRVWRIRLPHRLPVFTVPLREPDPDARVDLQTALADAYERGAYDMTVDYRAAATPPLPPNLGAWADALLRERGLR